MQELTPESVLEQQTPAQEAEAQAAEETRLPEDLPLSLIHISEPTRH